VTVIKDCANRYLLSFVVDIKPVNITPINLSIGIDLGLKTFAVFSDGTQVKSPDYSTAERKIGLLQRQRASPTERLQTPKSNQPENRQAAQQNCRHSF
jgi:putative transposase